MQENKESTGITGKELTASGFEQMTKEILGKTTVTLEELETIFKMDELFEIKELTISAAETRQSRPYESNNYYAAMKYDLDGLHSYIKAKVSLLPADQKLKQYMELRKAFMALVERKYASMEDKLRELIKKQQVADGLPNV